VVNWKNAPAYNLTKFIATNIGKYIPVPNASNVRNSTDFISDIKNTDPSDTLRFVSFDIQNMYTNIRVEDILDSTDTQLKQNNIDVNTGHETVRCCDVVGRKITFNMAIPYTCRPMVWPWAPQYPQSSPRYIYRV
jgi:hypothetical protein